MLIIAGSPMDGFELVRDKSSALESEGVFNAIRQVAWDPAGSQEIDCIRAAPICGVCVVPEMTNDCDMRRPLYAAVSIIGRAAASSAVTVKLVLEVPPATVTLAGAINALELWMPIARLSAASESATVQLVVAPTAILVGEQVSDARFGVDHSNTVAFCEEVPTVALTTAWVFERTVAAVALTVPVAFPAGTMRLAGIASRAELEFSDTMVSAETGCDNVIAQLVLAPDITPVALQVTPERRGGRKGGRRLVVATCEFPPGVAVSGSLRLPAINDAGVALTRDTALPNAGALSDELLLVRVTLPAAMNETVLAAYVARPVFHWVV
jgi:hypothetical protein